jgi:hypothetical protein
MSFYKHHRKMKSKHGNEHFATIYLKADTPNPLVLEKLIVEFTGDIMLDETSARSSEFYGFRRWSVVQLLLFRILCYVCREHHKTKGSSIRLLWRENGDLSALTVEVTSPVGTSELRSGWSV